MKNLNIMEVHCKIRFLWRGGGGGGHKKPIYRVQLPKKVGCTVCRFKGGLGKKEGGGGGGCCF